MNTKFRFVISTLFLIGASFFISAPDASAATLSSGPVFGGISPIHAVCYIFNARTEPITFVSREIHSHLGGDLGPPVADDCGTTLAAGGICAVANDISARPLQAYSCKVVIVGSKANVRGTMELRGSSGTVENSDLR